MVTVWVPEDLNETQQTGSLPMSAGKKVSLAGSVPCGSEVAKRTVPV